MGGQKRLLFPKIQSSDGRPLHDRRAEIDSCVFFGFSVDLVNQDFGGKAADFVGWLIDRGERRGEKRALFNVVKAHHRNILRNFKPQLV